MAFTTMIPLRTRESFFRDPYFSDCWEIMDRHRKEFEQKASLRSNKLERGSGLDDFQLTPLCRRQHFPASSSTIMSDLEDSKRFGGSGLGIHSDRDSFKVSLDVQQFKPEELVVKTCDNSTIVIEGKHEEKKDSHGYISRNFTRKYTLPDGIKAEEVQCNFTADGILHITAPRHQPQPQLTNGANTNATSSTKEHASQNNANGGSSDRRETSSNSSESSISRMSQKIEEHRKRAEEQFEKSTADLLARERKRDQEDFGHSKLLRMFDPHFQAFPEFDPVPFWKRGDRSSLLDETKTKKSASSLLDEFRSNKKTSSLLDDLNLDRDTLLSNSSSSTELQTDRENFKVMLDVQQFTPEELTVKTFDYFVVIEGKHEAKSDPHGFITRQFKRKYMLPRDVKAVDVHCNLSSDGILLVTAPRQKPNELESAGKAKLVPIQQQMEGEQKNSSSHQREKVEPEHRREEETASSSNFEREHVIPIENQHQMKETSYESSSTRQHQTSSAASKIGKALQQEHVIPIEKPGTGSSRSFLEKASVHHEDRPHVSIRNAHEHVIPIVHEHQNGFHVEFPESRPESSASTIPFDFSRQGSEAPVSVASSAPPTAPVLADGERIINISTGF